jgi:hypothetical protein
MAKTTDTKQTDNPPPRRNWVSPVAPDAGAAATAAFARAGFHDATLVLRWAEIVGRDVAAISTPIKLTETPGGATLTLKTEPGGAMFLQHETRKLCEQINAYLGREAVTRLRLIQGELAQRPRPRAKPAIPASAPPGDAAFGFKGPDKVREALINLARARRTPPTSD